ncbi:MAG: T9SS type A sorting domain-containing protein [Chitinophagaceae bacterium]
MSKRFFAGLAGCLWSVVLMAQTPYPSPPVAAGNITRLEYFFDVDPGMGNGKSVSITAATDLSNVSFNADVSTLANGFHRAYVRSMSADGRWSLTNFGFFDNVVVPFYPAAPAAAGNITELEYFIDTDPGAGNGTKLGVNAPDLSGQQLTVNVTGLASGVHLLYIRSKDVNGKWSLTNFALFDNTVAMPYPSAPAPAPAIGQMEYYIDTDPGFGKGAAVSFTAGTDLANLSVTVSLSGLTEGTHTLYIRSRQNPWSMSAAAEFIYDSPLPLTWLYVKGELRNQQGVISWATAQESKTDKFVIEHSIDGRTYTAVGEQEAAHYSTSSRQYSFTHAAIQPGINYYRIKQLDMDGNFTYSKVVTLLNKTGVTTALVAPNPVSNMLHIVEPAGQQLEKAEVIDMNGRVVLSGTFRNLQQVYSMDVSRLQKGSYVVKLYHPATTQTIKILKQ